MRLGVVTNLQRSSDRLANVFGPVRGERFDKCRIHQSTLNLNRK
jgi:hypothetical protein